MQRWLLKFGLLLLPWAFVVLLWLASFISRDLRLDLSEDQLYTLTSGTKDMLSSLESELTLIVYFSDELSQEVTSVQFFADRLADVLAEMTRVSDGRLRIEWRDPAPFSEAEDEALLAGINSVPMGPRNESFYFGVVIESETNESVVIPFLTPDQEGLLEYQLMQSIEQVTRSTTPRIAVVSGLPLQIWLSYQQMQDRYEVVELPQTAQALPSDVDLVLLIQPQTIQPELFDDLIAAIGNKIPFFVLIDPLVQSVATPVEADAKIDDLLALFGLTVDLDRFIADAQLGLQVTLDPEGSPVRHPAILGVAGAYLNSEDVVTANLEAVNVATVGQIRWAEGAGIEVEPLWLSSLQSGEFPIERLLVDREAQAVVAELRLEVEQLAEQRVMAVRSSSPTQAIVVADVDFLADQYWVSRQSLFGADWVDAFASNGGFVLNAIDHLLGDRRLIGLRNRQAAFRPFERVDELRRSAESQFLSTEQALELALAEANDRLSRLRSEQASDLSDADRAQLEAFLEERTRLRQELRSVRQNLDREIKALGQKLAWFNIALMPVLLLVVYLLLRRHLFGVDAKHSRSSASDA